MTNVKWVSIIALVLLCAFLSIGCWDRTEVSDLAIVMGTGIDRIPGNEPILLTVQIIDPSGMKQGQGGGGSQGQPFLVKTVRGESLIDAIRNLSKDLARTVYFDHNKAVILGEQFAKSGVSDAFDHMERNKEFRRSNFVLVTDKMAKDILNAQMDLAHLPAESLEELFTHNTFTYPTNRNEFLLGMKHIEVSTAPVIQLADGGKIHIEKTAIFKNYRLIGFLTENESKDLLWLTTKLKQDTVTIPFKLNGREEKVTIDIFNPNTRVTPRQTEKEINMEILCNGKAILREAGNTDLEIDKEELFGQLEQKTEQILKKRVEQTINSAQTRFHADFIGFGNHIHNSDPVLWKSLKNDWDKNFSKIKYNVNFQIKIVDIGVIGDSVNEFRGKE